MQRLEVSGAVRPLYGPLGVKGLNLLFHFPHASIAPDGSGTPQYRGLAITLGRTPVDV